MASRGLDAHGRAGQLKQLQTASARTIVLWTMRQSKDLFAYTDETGNTGLKIFDDAQPFFHTLTIIAREDLSKVVAPLVSEWCATLKVNELHASELGVGRLERVAPQMLEFLMRERPDQQQKHLSSLMMLSVGHCEGGRCWDSVPIGRGA